MAQMSHNDTGKAHTQGADAFCRDCLTRQPPGVRHCGKCSSVRLVAHPELFELSIAHLDCDAFFAAVEKRDDPSLADKPLIIGGGKRGVVSTCCYIARTYGVRSAMPMFKALKACPHAVVRKPNGEAIHEAAQMVRAEMQALTPLVQPLSIDEAFMDLSGTEKLHGAPPAITLARLSQSIEQKVGITVSIGLSHNKFLAKVASELDKPRGFAVIGREETISFLSSKPITLIWGVGANFAKKLERDGFRTIGDLQRTEMKELVERYGEHGLRLAHLAHGKDTRTVRTQRETKSLSSETTFAEDIRDRKELEDILWGLCEKVSRRMKDKGFNGRVVTLKLKTASFRSFTRRRTLDMPTNLAGLLFETGRELLKEAVPTPISAEAYRLIGIGFSDLSEESGDGQTWLFTDMNERLSAREQAIDELRDKFGQSAIATGRTLGQNRRKMRSKDKDN